jgi:parvulin-like peptidyl-prolyl isomerase
MKISFHARLLTYAAVLAYVALDLFAFRGPLRHSIDSRKIDSPESVERAKQAGLIALVLGRPIHTAQLERAAQERAWMEGKTWNDVPAAQRKLIRKACLGELIDHQLIRSKIAANKDALRASEEEINQRYAQLLARFSSKDELEKSMNQQGIVSEQELRLRLAAQIEMEKYIERQLQPLIAVSDDEITGFYQKHVKDLQNPAMAKVRHIFFATLEKDPAAVKATAEQAIAALTGKQKTFEQLAGELSDDPKSKTAGGLLGWIEPSRMPADFAIPVMAMAVNQPALLQTKLGWHVVEVLEKRDATPRTIEQCREEIITALQNGKRQPALDNLRQAIRNDHRQHTHIYDAVLDSMP